MIVFLFITIAVGNAAAKSCENDKPLCVVGIPDGMNCTDYFEAFRNQFIPSNCMEYCELPERRIKIVYSGEENKSYGSCDANESTMSKTRRSNVATFYRVNKGCADKELITIHNDICDITRALDIGDTDEAEDLCKRFDSSTKLQDNEKDAEEPAPPPLPIAFPSDPIVDEEIDFITNFATKFDDEQLLNSSGKNGCYRLNGKDRDMMLHITSGSINETTVGMYNETFEEFTATFYVQLNKSIEGCRPEKEIGWNSYERMSPISSVPMAYTARYKKGALQASKGYLNVSKRDFNYSLYDHSDPGFMIEAEYKCGYFNQDRSASVEGVDQVDDEDGNIVCETYRSPHLLLFASWTLIPSPKWYVILKRALVTLSCFSLMITIATLVWLKKQINNNRTQVQIGLSVSLLFVFVLAILVLEVPHLGTWCSIVACSLHYFLLSTGFWMLLEAIILFRKTSSKALRSSNSELSKSLGLQMLIACFIPFVITSGSATYGYYYDLYLETLDTEDYKICLVRKDIALYSLVIPLLVIISINLIIVFKVTWVVHKLSKKKGQPSSHFIQLKASLKAFLILIPSLGITFLPFLIGELARLENYFEYWVVKTVFSHTQGFTIFFVYCVLSRDVRAAIRAKLRKKKAASLTSGTSGT